MSVDVFLLFWMGFRHKVDNTKKEKVCGSWYLVLKMSDLEYYHKSMGLCTKKQHMYKYFLFSWHRKWNIMTADWSKSKKEFKEVSERKRGMHVPPILQFHIPAVHGGVIHTSYLLAQFKYLLCFKCFLIFHALQPFQLIPSRCGSSRRWVGKQGQRLCPIHTSAHAHTHLFVPSYKTASPLFLLFPFQVREI